MVSVSEASQIIQSVRINLDKVHLPITEVVGRVLAETVKADRDFPPFNRVAMDGVAVNSASYRAGRKLKIESVQAAGRLQMKLNQAEDCIEVMTGAMLPDGTDSVIRYEDVEIVNGYGYVKLDEVKAGMNIHTKGNDAREGDTVLEPGQLLSAAEIALLAAVGKTDVWVFEFPRTAIISSGDELVDIVLKPEPYQIRRSNTYSLQAAMMEMGWRGTAHHLPDNKEFVINSLRALLKENDILILSGGVSKGKFDFIPEALADLGVKKLFHQVKQKPGKPFWFGKSVEGKVVFALPGNPVSTFLCFYRYIKPWILTNMNVNTSMHQAVLAVDVEFNPLLSYFLQVSTRYENGKHSAYPVPGGGSGDFANLKNVDGFLELPADQLVFKAGEIFDYYSFR